jgi:hypothetical protein
MTGAIEHGGRMSWVLLGQLGVALVFGSAAVLKARSFHAFADDLRIPFRSAAASVAVAVISSEVLLAVSLVTFIGEPRVLATTGLFVVLATLFIALRLVLVDESECGCWGSSRMPSGHAYIGWQDSPRQSLFDALRPAGYGMRNSGLLLAIWLLMRRNEGINFGHDVMAAIIAPLLIIATGLGASIIHRLSQLNLSEHPLRKVLAPRLAPLVALSWYIDSRYGDTWVVRQDGSSLVTNNGAGRVLGLQ